jgi:hypothetical protein
MEKTWKENAMNTYETAYFAGGCFWCITPTFREMEGVLDVISGYSGGDEVNPTYEDVKYQRTGHRETIRIDYLPEKVSLNRCWKSSFPVWTLMTAAVSSLTGGIPIRWLSIPCLMPREIPQTLPSGSWNQNPDSL